MLKTHFLVIITNVGNRCAANSHVCVRSDVLNEL